MKKFPALVMLLAGTLLLADSIRAQDTNPCPQLPQTKLEGFETNTGSVILRATAPIGNVVATAGTLSVRCREIADLGTGRREFGLVIAFSENSRPDEMPLIDYDELDPLLSALDYLNKVDWSITSLPSFDAVFTTKGGFRVVAYGSRRTGGIEFAVRNTRLHWPPLLLSRDQLGQFKSLLDQARTKLDSLRQQK
jgi:hypothetical protein